MIYVLVKFTNTGWGTRINNQDVFHSVELFSDKATAIEVAEEWCEEMLFQKGNRYYGGTHKNCKLFVKGIQE